MLVLFRRKFLGIWLFTSCVALLFLFSYLEQQNDAGNYTAQITTGAVDLAAFEQYCRDQNFEFFVQEGCAFDTDDEPFQLVAMCLPVLCDNYEACEEPPYSYQPPVASQLPANRTYNNGYYRLPPGKYYYTPDWNGGYGNPGYRDWSGLRSYCDSIGGTYGSVRSAPIVDPYADTRSDPPMYTPTYLSSSYLRYGSYNYDGFTGFVEDYANSFPPGHEIPSEYFLHLVPTSIKSGYDVHYIHGCWVRPEYDTSGRFSPAGPNCESGQYYQARGCGPYQECSEGEGCNLETCQCEQQYRPRYDWEEGPNGCEIVCGNYEVDNGEECDSTDHCSPLTCQCEEGYESVWDRYDEQYRCVFDECPDDRYKLEPGACGCGNFETDSDYDGVPDCIDDCPDDTNISEAESCGCIRGQYEGTEECEGGALCKNPSCTCETYADFVSDGAGGCMCRPLDFDPYENEANPLWGYSCCKRASDPIALGEYGCPADRYCSEFEPAGNGSPATYRCRRTAIGNMCECADGDCASTAYSGAAEGLVLPEYSCETERDCRMLYTWDVQRQAYIFNPTVAKLQDPSIGGLTCNSGICCGISTNPNVPASHPCSCEQPVSSSSSSASNQQTSSSTTSTSTTTTSVSQGTTSTSSSTGGTSPSTSASTTSTTSVASTTSSASVTSVASATSTSSTTSVASSTSTNPSSAGSTTFVSSTTSVAATSAASSVSSGCNGDILTCPDGTLVGRDSANNCAFLACPSSSSVATSTAGPSSITTSPPASSATTIAANPSSAQSQTSVVNQPSSATSIDYSYFCCDDVCLTSLDPNIGTGCYGPFDTMYSCTLNCILRNAAPTTNASRASTTIIASSPSSTVVAQVNSIASIPMFVQSSSEELTPPVVQSVSSESSVVNFILEPYCGNGIQEGTEQCDDGNAVDADDCRNNCTVPPQNIVAARAVCGNGIREENEECDDSNRRDNDGCDSTCHLEVGICGDGIVQVLLGEQCESGDDLPEGVRCERCQYVSASCGDGILDSGEECDQGEENSNKPGASCRESCALSRCGDSIVDPSEQCDDGNRLSNDGCNRYCEIEQQSSSLQQTLVAGEVTTNQNFSAPGIVTFNPQQQIQFPNQPTTQQLPFQLPLAQLAPLTTTQPPIGDTGPAAIAVIAAGAAAGFGYVRKRRKK